MEGGSNLDIIETNPWVFKEACTCSTDSLVSIDHFDVHIKCKTYKFTNGDELYSEGQSKTPESLRE